MTKKSANQYTNSMTPYPGLEKWSSLITLQDSGIDLFMYDTQIGGGTPIIFIHGLGDEADSWRNVIPGLSNDFRCIALDLPGFGRSDKPILQYTIPFFTEVLLDLFVTLKIERAILIGHSAGSIIVHHFIDQHPERTAGVVYLAGPDFPGKQKIQIQTLIFMIPGIGEMLYTMYRWNPTKAYQSLIPFYYNLIEFPQAERVFLFQRVNERVWSDGQRYGYFSTFRNLAKWITAKQKTSSDTKPMPSIPSLVVWGEKDQINPIDLSRTPISNSLIIVPGAGHNVQQEKGQVVISAIRSLVSKIPSSL